MSQPLSGEHYCLKHQGNHSHYAEHNCIVCKLEKELAAAKQTLIDALRSANYWDSKLTEITRRHCDEIDVSAGLRKKLEAAQLHNKELREALAECGRHAHSMAVWGGERWTYHPPQARKIAESSCNALAKQPDTCALEALIEAETNRCCGIIFGMCDSDNVAQRTVAAIRKKP